MSAEVDRPMATDGAALARRLNELPPWPRALVEAQRAAARPDLSTAVCIQVIEQDPVLAAQVVRLANAPFYGASGHVVSVADAVRFLGLRAVVGALTAVCLRGLLAPLAAPDFDFDAYWRHALATGIAARELARSTEQDPDEAFLAGLLHDVGRLVAAVLLPGPSSSAAVDVPMPVTAADLGAAVARHWHFPPAIVEALALHRDAAQALAGGPRGLAVVVHLAEHAARAFGAAPVPEEVLATLAAPLVDALSLDAAGLQHLWACIEGNLAALDRR